MFASSQLGLLQYFLNPTKTNATMTIPTVTTSARSHSSEKIVLAHWEPVKDNGQLLTSSLCYLCH